VAVNNKVTVIKAAINNKAVVVKVIIVETIIVQMTRIKFFVE